MLALTPKKIALNPSKNNWRSIRSVGKQRASLVHVDAAQLRPAVRRHLAAAEKKAIRIQEY